MVRNQITNLSRQLSQLRDPKSLLPRIREVRAEAWNLHPHANKALQALEMQAHRAALALTLQAMQDLARADDWRAVRKRAAADLQQPGLPAASKAALEAINEAGEQLEALQELEAILAVAEKQAPAEIRQALGRLKIARLPAALQTLVRGLQALADLRIQAEGRWQDPPTVAVLKAKVADLQAATRRPDLALRLLQDLAVKAWLDGHGGEARALLPAHGPAENGARLLADMKALVLSRGEVTTWPVRNTLAAGAGQNPPPGPRLLIPTADIEKWQVQLKEPAAATALTEAAALHPVLCRQTQAALGPHRQAADKQAGAALQRVQQAAGQLQQEADQDARGIEQVEFHLGRGLTDIERALAVQLWHEGQQLATILRELNEGELLSDEERAIVEAARANIQRQRVWAVVWVAGTAGLPGRSAGGDAAVDIATALSRLRVRAPAPAPPRPKEDRDGENP